MKLTIIPVDGTINNGGKVFIGLDLTPCNIPTDVHALQWEEYELNKGHIEFKSAIVQNQEITELPVWATACVTKWNEAKATEEAQQEAARIAAEQAAQQTGQ
jgi:hypothetical protein